LRYVTPTDRDPYARLKDRARARNVAVAIAGRAWPNATEFYRQHRVTMDRGAIVAWPERFNHDELSGIQHAMNLPRQNEAAFFADYQNDPLPEATIGENQLTATGCTVCDSYAN
jgi:hypothetical protein